MPLPRGFNMAIVIGGQTYASYEDYITKTTNLFQGFGDVLSGLDERLDYLNKTALRMEAALRGEAVTEITPSPEYRTYIREHVSLFERIGDALTGADERLDFLNDTFLRIVQLLAPPALPGVPPVPPGVIPPPVEVRFGDLILSQLSLDIRSFLILLYRLGRAREERIFNYLEVDAAGTKTYTYTVEAGYVYIPHVEEVNLGLQRVITRYDYEGGNLIHTETYAIDRTVEWTMTPLSKVIEGSFGVSFYNGGTTDTWVKSRFLGSLMRQSDYLWWRQKLREISRQYLGFTA